MVSATGLTPDAANRLSTFFTKASSLQPGSIMIDMLNAKKESDLKEDARPYTTVSRSVEGDIEHLITDRIPSLEEL